MRVGSLFSGIGGMDLGLERAGMEIVWQVEIDDWCQRILERHFPDAVRYGDVRDCHGAFLADTCSKRRQQELRGAHGDEGQNEGRTTSQGHKPSRCCEGRLDRVDIICGGFPCQPVSHAGRRLGAEDDRWLWPEFLRIIREVRPRWVLVENVPGLLSIDSGRLFGGVLRDLAESRYDAEWDCIPASALGAPHIRDRVFIMAHAQCAGLQGYGGEYGLFQASREIETGRSGWWAVEPDVGRVAHGVPARVDRLRGLGNAVVPQVAECIGRMIMEAAL